MFRVYHLILYQYVLNDNGCDHNSGALSMLEHLEWLAYNREENMTCFDCGWKVF